MEVLFISGFMFLDQFTSRYIMWLQLLRTGKCMLVPIFIDDLYFT